MSLVEILRTKYRNTFSPIPHRSPLQFFPQLGGSIGEHCRNKINFKKNSEKKRKKGRKKTERRENKKETNNTNKKKKTINLELYRQGVQILPPPHKCVTLRKTLSLLVLQFLLL